MSDERKQGSLLGQAWLVLCLAIVFGAGLALVQIGLGPIIAENQKKETFGQIEELVPGACEPTSREILVGGEKVIQANSKMDGHKGWVVRAQGAGFADVIKVLVGLNSDASLITGIYVLQQSETPNLGDFIKDEEKFRRWFRRQKTAFPLDLAKQGTTPKPEAGLIKPLSGATISSRAVTEIVNARVKQFRADLYAHNLKKKNG